MAPPSEISSMRGAAPRRAARPASLYQRRRARRAAARPAAAAHLGGSSHVQRRRDHPGERARGGAQHRQLARRSTIDHGGVPPLQHLERRHLHGVEGQVAREELGVPTKRADGRFGARDGSQPRREAFRRASTCRRCLMASAGATRASRRRPRRSPRPRAAPPRRSSELRRRHEHAVPDTDPRCRRRSSVEPAEQGSAQGFQAHLGRARLQTRLDRVQGEHARLHGEARGAPAERAGAGSVAG